MSDDKKDAGDGKKLNLKMLLLVGGLLLGEAALIIGAMMLLGRDPDVAMADGVEMDPLRAEQEKLVEVLVLDGKLPNAKSGVSYLYSTEVYVQVKKKHEQMVSDKVQQFYNEIKADVTAVWRTSDPRHFQEPRLETLTRKLNAMMQQRFGVDEEDGEPVVQKCIIVMGTGFRVDR